MKSNKALRAPYKPSTHIAPVSTAHLRDNKTRAANTCKTAPRALLQRSSYTYIYIPRPENAPAYPRKWDALVLAYKNKT